MTSKAQSGKLPPRLNPFAFPADTDFRFVLLMTLVLTSSLYIYWQLGPFAQQITSALQCKAGVSFTDCAAPYLRVVLWWLLGGVMLLLAVAGGIYWLFPTWKLRRDHLVPLTADDAPEMVTYLAHLCHETGLPRPPVFVLNPSSSGTDGMAFGRLGQYYVVLSGGLVTLFITDRAAFRAILLHELAHLVNADVNKTYFTVAIWWAFVTVALVPFIVYSIRQLLVYPGDFLLVGNEVWRILVLSIVVYVTRNAALRARESYADVRASTWDGQSGALARVLASLSHPRGRWRAVIDVHPNPKERSQTLHETQRLFRIGFWEALGVGIAMGIAIPIMQLMLLLVDSSLASSGARLETLGPALIFAPFAVGVVGLEIWRATFAARAQNTIPTSVGRVGLCLGVGIMLGTFLSFSNYFEPNSMYFAIVFIYSLPWNVLLLISLFFFFRWIEAGASAWLDIAITARSLRLIYTIGLTIASVVLAVWLAELFGFTSESEFVREGGLASFDPALVILAVPARFVNAILRPETLLVFISLWAFPLSAWFWRKRVSIGKESNWAFLDASFQHQSWSRLEPLSPRFALTLGLQVGIGYCILLLVIRFGLRIGTPETLRQTDQFKAIFYAIQVLMAVLLQGVIAAIVASKIRQLGSLHGLFAAWIAGCVMVLSILDLNVLFGGITDLSFTWMTFCFVVNGGALLALPLSVVLSAMVKRASQMHRREVTLRGAPGFIPTIEANTPSSPGQPPYEDYPLASYQVRDYQPSTGNAPTPHYASRSSGSPVSAVAILPQKKSNRFLWVSLSIVACMFVLLFASNVYFFLIPPSPAKAITSTSTTTLTTYCAALKRGDYHTAYNQLSSGIQHQRIEAVFTSTYSTVFAANGGLSDCTISNVKEKGQIANGVMTLVTGNGMRSISDCTLVDAGDGWKIVSIATRQPST